MISISLKRNLFAGVVINTLLIFSLSLNASGLSFRRYFSDNMVLQRDTPVNISGLGEKGSKVTVTFGKQKKSTKVAADGTWQVTLDAIPATDKPGTLKAESSNGTAEIKNVLVGDVFLLASQSKIDISLGKSEQGQKALDSMKVNPLLRFISIKTTPELKPLADLKGEATKGWSVVDKQVALGMTGRAYFFGQDLASELKVPVGIVDVKMGANFTIGWISREAIMGSDEYFGKKTPVEGYVEFMEKDAYNFDHKDEITDKRTLSRLPEEHPITDPRYPAAGFNAVLNPLRGITLKGILLQLGNDYPYLIYDKLVREGKIYDRKRLDYGWSGNYILRKHAFRAGQYIIPRIPFQWRKNFGDKNLPIAWIMPPSSDLGTYALHHVEMRELQRKTAVANPNIGLVLPGNESISFSGQPKDDVLLAERCVSWALSDIYNRKDIPPCGPLFDHLTANYSKAQIFFKKGTADGLKAGPGALDKFEVAGIDGEFSPAKAVIDGDTIRLSSDKVSRIAYARYNWCAIPDQSLVNSAGLPAIPFRSDDDKFVEFPRGKESNLPMEYSTHACDWESGDVAIISGGGASFGLGDGYLGATGLATKPFGPNMLVDWVISGSPAEGKILPGDMIYSVNGKLLDDNPLHMVADAIALAESEEGGGKISFGLRREGENTDVDLQLEVLGTYSVKSPYDCPKVDKIVAKMEEYLAKRGGESSSYASGGWLHTDTLFLLAAGTPEYQGLVRRVIYRIMDFDPDTKPMPKGGTWGLAYTAMLLGEYYLATGDKNILPYFEWYCKAISATQVKKDSFPGLEPGQYGGWRHNSPGGIWYGMLPPIGLPAMIGYTLADEIGVEIDRECFDLAMNLFRNGQAEMGINIYTPHVKPVEAPQAIDPEAAIKGRISSNNGGRGMSAVLFNLQGDTRIAHLNSLYCIFAYNNCHGGHGSNFFNGLWTPIGAYVHSKQAFVNFMQNHFWFQDLRRMYNYTYKPSRASAPSMGHALSLVIPRQRLRILGAPESIFAKDQKEMFKPALEAYYSRDYDKAEELAELMKNGELLKEDEIKAEQLIQASKEIQKSIDADLTRVDGLIKAGKLYEASLDIPQLKGVMPENDARLAAVEKKLSAPEAKDALKSDKKRYDELQKSLSFSIQKPQTDKDNEAKWKPLTTEAKRGREINEDATQWCVKTLESVSQAPKDWMNEDFDDSNWGKTSLPISWYVNHSFVARAPFEVKDKSSIESLRISFFAFRQLDLVVYINGKPVAKINKCENAKRRIKAELNPSAVKYLKNGRNIIGISTRNDWRWGTYGGVVNGGFGISLDAKMKE